MHTEIRPTDVQWLAEGWWRHYHKHRRGTGNILGITAVIALILGAAFVLAGLVNMPTPVPSVAADNPPWAIAMIVAGAALVLAALLLFFRADSKDERAEDKFLDYVLDQWEQGNTSLPDVEMVAEYLKQQELRR